MTRLMSYLVAVACGIMTLGFGAEAHANTMRVRLDNHLNPSGYANAVSSGTMEVCLIVDGEAEWFCDSDVLDTVSASHNYDIVIPGSKDYLDVVDVVLEFHSPGTLTDLLVIDQIELWSISGTDHLRETWGVDNEEGYCFSSQSADFSNSHCGTGDYLDNELAFFTPPWAG